VDGEGGAAAEDVRSVERHFVLALGGFALEIAGATLVTHEHLPVPRFNFVEVRGVARERQSAFFERALDHYFQRALRPSVRVPRPVPDHLDAGLRRFGFRPRPAPLALLVSEGAPGDPRPPGLEVRAARPGDLDLVASFWTSDRERPEFRAALEVATAHPNPNETLIPVLAGERDGPVSAALVYRRGTTAGIFAVATRPPARGRGAASELVDGLRAGAFAGPVRRYAMFADSARLVARLERLGFAVVAEETEYELAPDAQLALPDPGPPVPPRWRPPRARATGTELS
jgi:hypothetical protein